jgi:hypothetical protein
MPLKSWRKNATSWYPTASLISCMVRLVALKQALGRAIRNFFQVDQWDDSSAIQPTNCL